MIARIFLISENLNMNKVVLAPYVRVGFLDGVLHFGFGSLRQLIADKKVQDCLLDAAVLLKQPHSMEEISSLLAEKKHSKQAIGDTLAILAQKFILPEGIYNRDERHSRSLLFYSMSGAEAAIAQKSILNKKVAIVGCGGIGNVVGVLLATAGVESFVLVDQDRIELSNISRQIMFSESDCGNYKTTVLAEALKSRSSQLNVVEIREFLNEDNCSQLEDVDFILVSGDQEGLTDLINRFAVQHCIPFMNVGYVEDIAVWGPLVVPGQSGCHNCKRHLVSYDSLSQDVISKCQQINKGYQVPSSGPINAMASSFAALDILRFFGNFGEVQSFNTRIGIWSHDLRIEKQDYSLNPSCEICGFLQKIG